MEGATATARVVLFCAAQLAHRLAIELGDDGIVADAEGDWSGYIDALDKALMLADSEQSPQELIWALSNIIAVIMPPRGRP